MWSSKTVETRCEDFDLIQIRGQGRPRFGNGRTYKSAADRAYERDILLGFAEENDDSFKDWQDEVRIRVAVTQTAPKATSDVKDGLPYVAKPDGSNILKSVEDALNGYAWKDDSQITEAVVTKQRRFRNGKPHMWIEVSYVRNEVK